VEYPHAARALARALHVARERGYLGRNLRDSGRDFDISVRLGAGAYICGEETSMLESLEGRRGEVRVRPPLPAIKGLFGQPTVVNNVVTLATVPAILARGAEFYRDLGFHKSRGTVLLQLAGNVKRGGLVERAFGLTVNQLVHDYGGGTASGRPVRAVQVGGPLGAYLPPAAFDTTLDYESLAARSALLGHAGVVVFDDTVDMARMARFALEFCAIESCGKCTPAASVPRAAWSWWIGSWRIAARARRLALLDELCDTMANGSLCGSAADAVPGAQRAQTFSRGFLADVREGLSRSLERRRRAVRRVTLEIDGVPVTVPRARRSCGRCARGTRYPEALCHRHAEGLRFLPRLPGRDRRPQGFSGFLHHRSRGGHEGANRERALTKLRRGVLELYVSEHPWAPAGQQPLRARDAGRRVRHYRIAIRGRSDTAATFTLRNPSTPAIHTSASTTIFASSARAACAPVRTRREPSRSPSKAAASIRELQPRSSSRSSSLNA
jgi:hypothetical protein